MRKPTMNRLWSTVAIALSGLPAIAFWWFVLLNQWIMDVGELFPVAMLMLCLGPYSGGGACLCVWEVYRTGWRAVPIVILPVLIGAAAFLLTAYCFVFLLSGGC